MMIDRKTLRRLIREAIKDAQQQQASGITMDDGTPVSEEEAQKILDSFGPRNKQA